MSSERLNCWLDCDPGSDDAFAIVMALFSDKLNLLGISTVAGNQTIDKTTKNTLDMLNILGLIDAKRFKSPGGMALPVIKGAEKPFLRPLVTSSHVYGETGLNSSSNRQLPAIPSYARDAVFKAQETDDDTHFTTKMYRAFKQSTKPVTLIAVGPMTNVAMLLLNHPEVVAYIDKIVIMGGSLGQGNTGAMSEFNIHVDPEAAAILMDHASRKLVRVYMVPLETCYMVRATQDKLEEIEALNTVLSDFLQDLLLFVTHITKEAPIMHDPCAMAFVLDPSIFTCKLMRVDIELSNPLTAGQTICDVNNFQNRSEDELNCYVCLKVEPEGFWSMMIDSIRKASEACRSFIKNDFIESGRIDQTESMA